MQYSMRSLYIRTITALSHCDWMDVPECIYGLNSCALSQGRLYDGDGGHPWRAPIASLSARSAAVRFPSLTMCPHSADRRISLTGGRPVASVTVVLRTLSRHPMPRIRRWHRMWNACSRFVSTDSRVHVSDP